MTRAAVAGAANEVFPEVIRSTSTGTIVATTRGYCEIGAAISSAV
jgi:hypothetical protein